MASSDPINCHAEFLSRGYNGAGHALFCQLLREPDNIVLSPLSIGAAMTMAQVGARGETEREMARLFTPDLAPNDREQAYAALLAVIDKYNTNPASPADELVEISPDLSICVQSYAPPETRITIANGLALVQPGLVSSTYVATLADLYGADVLKTATVEQINAWIRERTNGLIQHIVENIDPMSAAIIINALYFKANWSREFWRDLTCDGDFHLASGETVKTPMMRDPSIALEFATGEGYRAIRMPYAEARLGMTIVLPDEGQNIVSLAQSLGAHELTLLGKALQGATHKVIDLTLPKFKASNTLSLGQHLRQLGILLAFDEQKADFADVAAEADLPFWIGEVQHSAVVDVNEEGTEAAAATMVIMAGGAAFDPPEPEPFKVDRPFLFYITDAVFGIVLFQGRIADPRSM